METIIFPDVEAAYVTYLTEQLPLHGLSVAAYGSVPPVRPDSFVVVQRVGGVPKGLVVDSPTLIFECWAETASAAYTLATYALGIVRAGRSVAGVTVYRVAIIGGPGLLPDPDSKRPRYTFTASVDVRGSAV